MQFVCVTHKTKKYGKDRRSLLESACLMILSAHVVAGTCNSLDRSFVGVIKTMNRSNKSPGVAGI